MLHVAQILMVDPRLVDWDMAQEMRDPDALVRSGAWTYWMLGALLVLILLRKMLSGSPLAAAFKTAGGVGMAASLGILWSLYVSREAAAGVAVALFLMAFWPSKRVG